MNKFKRRGWAFEPQSDYEPTPGDLVFWWRERLSDWQGHVGLVHQLKDGMLYTIEGNRSELVQGFSYVFSRMEKLQMRRSAASFAPAAGLPSNSG